MSISSARLPLLAAIFMSLAMAGSLAWQGYHILAGEETELSTDGMPASEARQEPAETPDISLASVDLFGAPGEEAAPEPEDTENLPETNLRLVLRGVLAANGEYPASALVEDSRGNTEAYLVGDELPAGATLRSVHPQRIIIERGGKLENLYFPELKDVGAMAVISNEDADSRSQQNQYQPQTVQQGSSSPIQQPERTDASEQRREEIRQRLEQLRERLRNNTN
ncbi:type II secretion system protein N [Marinobacter sp.]|uniref:type II secretion system protein N n=1 Tax=Marinobacter sp. TaxID=50741 RepID=UPI00384DEEDF